MNKKDRLSSENLYHFKQNLQVVKSILTNGFRHNLWEETIPYKASKQMNFMVSFCDIKIEDAGFHRKIYGDNAIVLTKEWGKQNGVSPIRYVHKNSPGISTKYIQSKNRFREIRTQANDHQDTIVQDYSIFSVLLDEGKLHYDSIAEDIKANSNLLTDLNNLEKEFTAIFNTLTNSGQNKLMSKYLRSLMNRISDLHNELERRDAFIRTYTEDFKHPASGIMIKNKVLYDEREWRSIKFANKQDYNQAIINKHLPQSYNLKFTDQDVLAILCADPNALDELKTYIENNTIILDKKKTVNKLTLIDDYQE